MCKFDEYFCKIRKTAQARYAPILLLVCSFTIEVDVLFYSGRLEKTPAGAHTWRASLNEVPSSERLPGSGLSSENSKLN